MSQFSNADFQGSGGCYCQPLHVLYKPVCVAPPPPQRLSLTWTIWRGWSRVLQVRAAAAAVWPERACTSSSTHWLGGLPQTLCTSRGHPPPSQPPLLWEGMSHACVCHIVCKYYTCVCSDLVQLNTPPPVSSHRVEHTSSSSEEEGGWSVLGGSGFSPLPQLSSRRQQQVSDVGGGGGGGECCFRHPSFLPLHSRSLLARWPPQPPGSGRVRRRRRRRKLHPRPPALSW